MSTLFDPFNPSKAFLSDSLSDDINIFVDNLISIIDDAVEKTEDYEKRISQEYGIFTETEK